MAMLAEKRTKTKYFLHHKALNPRGNLWCEDSNKIGQRLLEKMGWSPGKGLGASEDGVTDPIRISYKWDSKGMGFKGGDGTEDVAQQTEFNSLLAQLNSNQEEAPANPPKEGSTESPKSLELASQKSRARVHYHKFTRGKDLSRASAKDLECILGVVGQKTEPPETPSVIPEVGPPIESTMQTTFGVTTIARGNLNNYFKQKFLERQTKAEPQYEETDDKEGIVGEFVQNESSERFVAEKKGKKKKSKKPKAEESEVFVDMSAEVSEDSPVKKKKKTKSKCSNVDTSISDMNETVEGNQVDEEANATKCRRKSVTWGDVEVSFVSKYIKDMVDTSTESLNTDNGAIRIKKKKKKNKVSHSESDNYYDEGGISPDNEGTETQQGAESAHKRKKRKNKSQQNVDTDSVELADKCDFILKHEEEHAEVVKVKKKKKKSQEELTDVECKENLLAESGAGEEEFKKPKKGKKRSRESDFAAETVDDKPSDGDVDSSAKIKKKKKKQGDERSSEVESGVLKFDVEVHSKERNQGEDDESKGGKEKRKKKKENGKEKGQEGGGENETAAHSESSGEPVLSALTKQRMEKWKERKDRNKEVSASESTQTLKLNPFLPTQDYNGRKVLAALKVKCKPGKDVVVNLPPSNFIGSNLDSIIGYGPGVVSR